MYSPKISEELIPILYSLAKQRKIPMTRLIDELLQESLKTQDISEINALSRSSQSGSPPIEYQDDIKEVLRGLKIKLDCRHHCTIGHQLANTLIIVSLGGGEIETYCHNCYA
jgi:hypothetical protein